MGRRLERFQFCARAVSLIGLLWFAAAIEESAWYLSIVGVAPSAQGRGIGARLIEPTLAEADEAGAHCYLETFDSRNPRFYQRLGFSAVGSHVEPVTGSAYTIVHRSPQPRPRG